MTELNQVYKCNICGNIVEVLHTGAGQLTCCNKPMVLLKENTVDASKEKHVPAIEKAGNRVTVKVGGVEHPMEEKHYIEWIEVIAGDKVYRKYLKPGEKPAAEFEIKSDSISVRSYCNLHGLWFSQG
ncbi:MAG: desulfoferrodoxin [Clostridia bacterium]|nr:desulfoferrodoxin [Clostridia bacterium]MDQ7791813.1 desulfoferrodoxin [Clostridia bacterium]